VVKALTAAAGAPAERPRVGRTRTPTIYQVAKHAGVSIATVSRVQRRAATVSEPTRRRVEQAIAELAYRPSMAARSLARGRHDAIGIVFPDLSGPYYSAVMLGYEEASAAEGRSVLILGTHGRLNASEQVVDLAGRVDGMVIMGQTVDDEVVADLDRGGIAIVVFARPAPKHAHGVDSIRTEGRASGRALVSHVLDHGHRDVAFVGDPEASPDAFERWAAFKREHVKRGLRPRSAIPSGYREADGRRAAAAVLRGSDRPTAIVAANDEIAMGVIVAARAEGIDVPGELAVTGWDDIPVARHLTPPLTTVRQPMQELGRRAAALLHERLSDNRTAPRHEVLPTELVVRSSCGCQSPTLEGD
jgi:LacI family transcriptional regulator